MNPKWAEENLQTIRTLMERSALYRRALAPIMLLAGVLGILAALAGLVFHLDAPRDFDLLWLTTAVLAVVGAFLIARRQALRDKEKFWSPPTRRVAQALLPPLVIGFFMGSWPSFLSDSWDGLNQLSAIAWIMFYGLALHSAGFFMPRGIKLFGWCLMALDCGLFYLLVARMLSASISAHWIMGVFFGGLHLAYGIYLYFTEKKNPVA